LADPKQQDVLKQINAAWEQAKAQLAKLREAVEHTGELAQVKVEQGFVGRARDKALRDLGEAIWSQVKAGRMNLPAGLAPAMKAIQEVERKAAAQNEEINALLAEGPETVARIKAPPNKSHKTAVARKGKKR